MKMQLIRNVTTNECGWLNKSLKKGEIVYRYMGNTFGCISSDGVAVSIEKDKKPFFELPENAVVKE